MLRGAVGGGQRAGELSDATRAPCMEVLQVLEEGEHSRHIAGSDCWLCVGMETVKPDRAIFDEIPWLFGQKCL